MVPLCISADFMLTETHSYNNGEYVEFSKCVVPNWATLVLQ